MELSDRDLAVVRWLARFRLLSTSHIAVFNFGDRSHTTVDNHIIKLVKQRYIFCIGCRPSSPKGGAGANVYQLGRAGWTRMGLEGEWRRFSSASQHTEHSLRVADTYAELVLAERAGVFEILHRGLEKHVGEARCDIYVELGIHSPKRKLAVLFEIDLDSEWEKKIKEKLRLYIKADDAGKVPRFAYVLFVTLDEERARFLKRWIKEVGHAELFSVCTFPQLVPKILSFE